MNEYDMIEAVGGIDPAFIEEAKAKNARRPLWRTVLPMAACLCLAIGGALAVKNAIAKPAAPKEQTAVNETQAAHPADTDKTQAALPDDTETSVNNGVNDPVEHGASVGFDVYGNTTYDPKQMVTFIDTYPGEPTEHPAIPAGQCCLSSALRAAMAEYGDLDKNGKEIIYNVAVEIYGGTAALLPCIGAKLPEEAEAETARLADAGIVTVTSKSWNEHEDPENTVWMVYLHATAEQIRNFPVSGLYGYWLELRSEAFDEYGEPDMPVAFSGANNGN